jgi:hypothetical protein
MSAGRYQTKSVKGVEIIQMWVVAVSIKLLPYTLALFALCLALASCGGGSSSSTASTPCSPGPAGPSGGSGPTTAAIFDLQGGGELIVNNDGTAVFQGTALSPGGATARFDGAQVLSGNGMILERLGSSTGLSVADYGAWYAPNGPLTAMNFFAAGRGGPAVGSALPVSGSASYAGKYVAILGSSPVSGPVTVTIANFSAPTVGVVFSGPISTGGNGPLDRSTGTYTFAGFDAPRGGALNGQGALYGNGAPETAGTFSGATSSEPVGPSTSQPFRGSFGAHR